VLLDVSVHQLFKQHFSNQCPVANESVVVLEEAPRIIVDLKTSEQTAVQTQLNVSRGHVEALPVEYVFLN
jgi:hypothetical protein